MPRIVTKNLAAHEAVAGFRTQLSKGWRCSRTDTDASRKMGDRATTRDGAVSRRHSAFGVLLLGGLHRFPLIQGDRRLAGLGSLVVADDAGGGHGFDQATGAAVADRE